MHLYVLLSSVWVPPANISQQVNFKLCNRCCSIQHVISLWYSYIYTITTWLINWCLSIGPHGPYFLFQFREDLFVDHSQSLLKSTHPELPPKDDYFSACLFLPEPPLHQVLAILSRQCHVASGYSWVSSTSKWIWKRHEYQHLMVKLQLPPHGCSHRQPVKCLSKTSSLHHSISFNFCMKLS